MLTDTCQTCGGEAELVCVKCAQVIDACTCNEPTEGQMMLDPRLEDLP